MKFRDASKQLSGCTDLAQFDDLHATLAEQLDLHGRAAFNRYFERHIQTLRDHVVAPAIRFPKLLDTTFTNNISGKLKLVYLAPNIFHCIPLSSTESANASFKRLLNKSTNSLRELCLGAFSLMENRYKELGNTFTAGSNYRIDIPGDNSEGTIAARYIVSSTLWKDMEYEGQHKRWRELALLKHPRGPPLVVASDKKTTAFEQSAKKKPGTDRTRSIGATERAQQKEKRSRLQEAAGQSQGQFKAQSEQDTELKAWVINLLFPEDGDEEETERVQQQNMRGKVRSDMTLLRKHYY